MEDNEKSGFTAEGRKLRPRRPRLNKDMSDSHSAEKGAEKVSYNAEDADYKPREYRGSEGGHGYSRGNGGYNRGSYSRGDYNRGSYNRGGNYLERRNPLTRQIENRFRSAENGSDDKQGGYQQRGCFSRGEGGYQQRGGYSRGEGGYQQRGGYNRGEGGYQQRGGYNRGEGGYQQRGGYNRGEGGYQQRGDYNRGEGGYQQRHEGGYQRHEGFSGHKSFGGNKSYGGSKSFGHSGGNRGGFSKGPKQGFGKGQRVNPYTFNKSAEEGITRMLSKKPMLDQIQVSDNDYVPAPIPEAVRLNKFIANSGVCSRREADQFIQAGVVSVNGQIVTELGVKINPQKDVVKFNDETLRGEEKVYIVMNKPKGYVTTASDPHAEKSVMDLLGDCKTRVFPVGRLDKNTTGVLMFTNDGEIAEKLTHPSFEKKKVYQVILDKPLTDEDHDKILSGITLSDGDIKADALEYIDPEDKKKLGIEIHTGRNRIIRRTFESLGYEVMALDRVYFAGLTKKGLKKGEWRYLSKEEANALQMGAYE